MSEKIPKSLQDACQKFGDSMVSHSQNMQDIQRVNDRNRRRAMEADDAQIGLTEQIDRLNGLVKEQLQSARVLEIYTRWLIVFTVALVGLTIFLCVDAYLSRHNVANENHTISSDSK